MKLLAPFIQLPLTFDAARLAEEIDALGEDAWRPHPQGYAGNWGLPLLAVNGDPDDDRTAGAMRPTPYLEKCPYTRQVLSTLGAVWGRTRFMRLDGNAEVQAHVDNNYYWRERVRVHIPVVTRPDVRFECGDAAVNMGAGECWIFDTWRLHRVLNPSDFRRIHLVADTVGSQGFWELVAAGRRHDQTPVGWAKRNVVPQAGQFSDLAIESFNRAEVMTPWELRDTLSFIFSEAQPHPELPRFQALAATHVRNWQSMWAQYGATALGKPLFRSAADQFSDALKPARGVVRLRNGVDLAVAIQMLALLPAVMDAGSEAIPAEPRDQGAGGR